MTTESTTSSSHRDLIDELRTHFATGATLSLGARQAALSDLERLVIDHESDLLAALHDDLGKSHYEGWLTELALVRQAIRDLKRRLPAHVEGTKIRVPWVQRPGTAKVRREPFGVCLVVAPWNYPVQLLLIPVITAIAAGNVVVAKPSELAPATSRVLTSILRDFDPRILRVVEGDATTVQELIGCRVDHIFLTGSSATGRAVMRAAADHLTPVTLELGGKSPAYIDADADLAVAARRIVFAKFLNAGQSCVAPDYLLAHSSIIEELVTLIAATLLKFYGENAETSADFGRIISDRHHERLVRLLEDSRDHIVIGGGHEASTRFIEPTVVLRPKPTSQLLVDEIFGPILPILQVESVDEAIAEINSHPSPLSIYCFTHSSATLDHIASRTRSGSVTKNTAAEQFATIALPFGGVGESGIGAYHAGAGLEAFSYERSYLLRTTRFETALAYPPLSSSKLAVLRRALRA